MCNATVVKRFNLQLHTAEIKNVKFFIPKHQLYSNELNLPERLKFGVTKHSDRCRMEDKNSVKTVVVLAK